MNSVPFDPPSYVLHSAVYVSCVAHFYKSTNAYPKSLRKKIFDADILLRTLSLERLLKLSANVRFRLALQDRFALL